MGDQCLTKHPGFEAGCLNQWALRLAGLSYRTKNIGCKLYTKKGKKNRSRVSASENQWLENLLVTCFQFAVVKIFSALILDQVSWQEIILKSLIQCKSEYFFKVLQGSVT